MSEATFLSVIVPAYNEVARIGGTLAAMTEYLGHQPFSYEIIVAADGNDGTREAVAALAATDSRIRVLGSPERGGKGKGVRQGVLIAHGEFVGFLDADYKTPIDAFDGVLPHLRQGADLVIGSRVVSGARILQHQPLYRRLGSRAFAAVMHTLVGLEDVSDTQCGFKFFRAPVAREIFSHQTIDGYMFDIEILLLAKKLGYRIVEVGVPWRDDGDTRYNPVTGTLRNARELLKIRLRLR
jgi:glycosyltransferase involved in cell wall biosynthesis